MADRIALVDDDQNILTSVALALESEGFEVDSYNDGETALAGLSRRHLDIQHRQIHLSPRHAHQRTFAVIVTVNFKTFRLQR